MIILYERITDEQRNFITQHGMSVEEEVELGDYDLVLIKLLMPPGFFPFPGSVYEIGLQRRPYNFLDIAQQDMQLDAILPNLSYAKQFIETVKDWIEEYDNVICASHNPEKTQKYIRILSRYGIVGEHFQMMGHDHYVLRKA